MLLILQHRTKTELVRPFFSQVLEWRENEDEIISRDSNNLMELLDGNLVDLMGENFSQVIDECIENTTYQKISRLPSSVRCDCIIY